ncbi:MAG: hypothetical protein ACRDU5_21510 [Mycobacterium sp.]
MSTAFALLVAAAAITVTYLMCVRPMLRGRGHCAGSDTQPGGLDREIADLQEQVRVLRAQDQIDSGTVPRPEPRPDTDR